jgi:hypothetical protein
VSVHPPRGRPTDNSEVSFVGRQPQLAVLQAQLDRARAGEPRLVLVEGPAGIGKTALVRDFLAHAGAVCVLRASGQETEASPAFGVLTQLVGPATTVPAGPLAALRDPRQRPDQSAGGRRGPGRPARRAPAPQPGGGGPRRRPLADSPSLHALTFALRRLRVDRLLALLLTREGTDPRLPGGLRRVLVGDHSVRLRLAGLDEPRGFREPQRISRGQSEVRAQPGRRCSRLRAFLVRFAT